MLKFLKNCRLILCKMIYTNVMVEKVETEVKKQKQESQVKVTDQKSESQKAETLKTKEKAVSETKNSCPVKIDAKSSTFSNTVFTDKNRIEISRYKKYVDRIRKAEKKAIGDRKPPKPTRFSVVAAKGLSNEQVAERVAKGQINYTKRGSTKTIRRILFTNLVTFFNLLCFAVAACLLIFVGFGWDLFFLSIVTVNVSIGIFQEIKAKYIIEKLSLVTQSKVSVIRNGEQVKIFMDDIVLDDVIVLANGQQIPADSIVMDGVIEVNESLLTGESNPIQKNKGDKIFAGSFVVSGVCSARVDRVGPENYVQTIARGATRYARPKSELLMSLRRIIMAIGFIIVPVTAILLTTQLVGTNLSDSAAVNKIIRTSAGAVIGMIPIGMFLLTSLALAVGVINLAKSNTLVQELYCIEMLARVDTLCLDKTGTITDGTMKVCDVVEIKNTSQYTIREIIASMLWALNENNQTAIALGNHFDRNGIIKAIKTLPFSSSRKLSAVSFEGEGTYIIGAPEFILKDNNDKVDEKVARFASQGYRVLLLARASGTMKDGHIPDGVKPVAIITIQDHIRKEAPATIKWFRDLGVDVRVISGDNPITVSEVARRAGILNAEKYISLEGMSPNEVRASAKEYTVFGRVTPEQKLILVKELKNMGRTVAMTGDGVNDILALKEADCSIAMATGSEAARNVSHLVLLDSNFASMPKVVMEGRRVVNNVQKASSLYLFKTLLTLMLIMFGVMVGTGYFFTTSDMFMLEWFIIGIPSFFLALEINNQVIKGKFIFNILKNAFAGAIVAVIGIILLYVMSGEVLGVLSWVTRNPDPAIADQFTTMSIFIIVGTGLMVLYRLIKPLNVYRGILYAIMLALVLTFAFYVNGLFDPHISQLAVLEGRSVLILVIMLQAAYPLIGFMNEALAKVRLDTRQTSNNNHK